jgi:nitrite reductase (NO-forming)
MAAVVQERVDSWIYRNREGLKSGLRIAFGLIWGIDAALKFQPGVVSNFPAMVQNAGNGQPAWLQGWFSFWTTQASQNAALWVYSTGVAELAIATGLIFGFLRKITYGFGFAISLVIWAVPEGFGGPYGPTATDIGTGIVYAFAFLLLMIVNATYGPSRYSVDLAIERRWPRWEKIAEIRGPWVLRRGAAAGSTGSVTPRKGGG